MKDNKKKLHDEIYSKAIKDYKYNSDYHPLNELVVDTADDYYNLYGTKYPNHDKTNYSKYPMRGYTKTDKE